MTKYAELLGTLDEIVKYSKNPILCWSGGKDSTFLLLSLIKQLKYSIPVLTFSHFWDKSQKEFIKSFIQKYGITVFFYRPVDNNFQNPYLITRYLVGNTPMPVIFDHVEDTSRCGIDVGKKALEGPLSFYIWDKTITGAKSTDTHELVEKLDFNQFESTTQIVTPLWDWTDEEVLDHMKELGYEINPQDTGEYRACMRCISDHEVFCPKVQTTIRGVYQGV
jgi:3'-phosphoadenosine 5'-phosphosulfate sulfotransferase (PAPS reductase)/FAD synthetase